MSLAQHFGYVMIDHRASPGLPEDMALALGYDPAHCREGKIYEQHTLGCNHCGAHVILNKDRQRARSYCSKCDRYICDYCEDARHSPDYVHRTIDELVDLLRSGKWALSGSMSHPVLTPIQGVII